MMPLCGCGCGQETTISPRTDSAKGFVAGQTRPFRPHHVKHLWKGAESPSWQGGRRVGSDGYVYLNMPEHARANGRGYVREHIVIVERAMGKPLPPKAEVHHFNERRDDNATPWNLIVCENRAYHMLLHQRQRALTACGNANALRCTICHRYENQADMYIRKDRRTGFHRSCSRDVQRVRYHSVRA